MTDRLRITALLAITLTLTLMVISGLRSALEPFSTPPALVSSVSTSPSACAALNSTQRANCKVGTIEVVGDKNIIRGNTVIAGDAGVQGSACLEAGLDVAGKKANAGKLCYQRWSDGLDVVGAGASNQPRKVTIWDHLHVNGSKLCLGGTCVTEAQLKRLLDVLK